MFDFSDLMKIDIENTVVRKKFILSENNPCISYS